MCFRHLLVGLTILQLPAAADPLPAGSYVDLIVVPVGPVPLAEFEADHQPAPPADGKKPAESSGAESSGNRGPGGGGSGVRVKEQNPEEIPPRAVYLAAAKGNHLQIPCYFNAVTTPVRVPVSDSTLVFSLRGSGASAALSALPPVTLTTPGRRVLMLLTKPLSDKRWTRPQITLIPLPDASAARLVVVNACTALHCGAVLNTTAKYLLPPLRHQSWSPAPEVAAQPAEVALAMVGADRAFQPPFYQDNLPLSADATTLLIAYEVTPQESFRLGKYILGTLEKDDFSPAIPYP